MMTDNNDNNNNNNNNNHYNQRKKNKTPQKKDDDNDEQKKKLQAGGLSSSLAPLLRHLTGLSVSIELKNGRVYRGILDKSDQYMNLVLHRAVRTRQQQQQQQQDGILYFGPNNSSTNTSRESYNPPSRDELSPEEYKLIHIRGPSIRYIHLPDQADLPSLIRAGIDRERAAMDKYRRGKRKTRS